jgi:hypothetical protein
MELKEHEHIFGPAWLYMGVLGIIVFAGLRLAGVGHGQGKRRTALTVMTSTVVSGVVIAGSHCVGGIEWIKLTCRALISGGGRFCCTSAIVPLTR